MIIIEEKGLMATGHNPYQTPIKLPDDAYIINASMEDSAESLNPYVYIDKMGGIHANAFFDANDDFSLEKDVDGRLQYVNKENTNTKAISVLTSDKSYQYSGVIQKLVAGYITDFRSSPEDYSEKTRDKYVYLSKFTKDRVEKNEGTNSVFHFHFTGSGGEYRATPKIASTWFKPCNIDLKISPQAVQSIRDLIVIKSGEFHYFPVTPSTNLVDLVQYSVGTSGHMYIDTRSLNSGTNPAGADSTIKRYKIPRTGNAQHGSTSPNSGTHYGPVGVFRNGIVAYSYHDDPVSSWGGLGTYHENYFEAKRSAMYSDYSFLTEGNETAAHEPQYTKVYKSISPELWVTGVEGETNNTTGHSPLLGFAFDGFPIYGPYGYSGNSTTVIKRMEPSYRLKLLTQRPSGPEYTGAGSYHSGYFKEDFEHIPSLGDLDGFNGKTGVTPEYPNGTYAYFTTVDEDGEPKFPYILGSGFKGTLVEENFDGTSAVRTEPVYTVTGTELNADLSLWEIFGLIYVRQAGIKKETIVYVSPHEMITESGTFLSTGIHQYLGTGGLPATFSGNLVIATGQDNKYTATKASFSYPSSKYLTMPSKLLGSTAISGGHPFLRVDPNTSLIQTGYAQTYVTGTDFYKYYKDHKSVSGKVYEGAWDGKIPFGVPFKIEVWSFNGYMNGFTNKINIGSYGGNAVVTGVALGSFYTGIGEGVTENGAYLDLIEKGNKELNRRVDNYWINKNVYSANRRMRRYMKFMGERGAA